MLYQAWLPPPSGPPSLAIRAKSLVTEQTADLAGEKPAERRRLLVSCFGKIPVNLPFAPQLNPDSNRKTK